MTRTRWTAAIVAVCVLVVSGVAYAVSSATLPDAAPAASSTTSTSASPTTTQAPPTSTTAPGPPTTIDDGSLHMGSQGDAVQAFEKLNGFAPDGRVTAAVQAALANPAPVAPLAPYGGDNRAEVDLTHQVLYVYVGGNLRLITHVSTGSGQHFCEDDGCNHLAITPIGSFRFSWRSSGWVQAPLGKLYNPVYFTSDGVAVHGSQSVPTYPASHGCVRIPMHIAEYFPSLVRRGDPIYVTDGRQVGPPPPVSTGPHPPDTPTTPGDDTTTTSTSTTTTSTTSTTTPTSSTSTTTTSTTLPAITTP